MDSSPTEAELKTRIRQQEVVADVGQQALEADDLDELMADVTETVAEMLDTDYCHVLELLPEESEFSLRQGVGWQAGTVGSATVPTERDSQAGYTLLSKEPIIVTDLSAEERFSGNELLVDHDVVSGITVLIGSVTAPWGILGTFTTDHRSFTEHDANFVRSVANVLASAIDRKERERELRRNNRQLETLFEVLPVGVVVAEDDGEIVTANETAHAIWGGDVFDADSVEEYERYSVRWADSGETVAPEEMTLARVVDGEVVTEPDIFEIDAVDGEQRIVELEGMPIRDETGAVDRGVVTMSDISERWSAQQNLEASNERLEQFAYAASHDLQEPLRMVTSYLQLLENRYADAFDDDGEEFLEFAVDGAERMREMIDGLLEYSRVETRGDPFEPVDLDAVLADVLEDLQLHIENSDGKITTEDLPQVEGDASQLRQVFQNLLSNAITYSGDEPPRVHVDAERRGSNWVISVRDEGIGIDPDDQDRVFTVFDRLHSRDEYDGTGIGLALCRRIVERHGGEIWVDSEPGEGATFFFTLPAASDLET